MREEFAVGILSASGEVKLNPAEFCDWLMKQAKNGANNPEKTQAKSILEQVEKAFDKRLAAISNRDLHPESLEVSGAAIISR